MAAQLMDSECAAGTIARIIMCFLNMISSLLIPAEFIHALQKLT